MNQLVSSPDAAIQQTCAIFRAQGDKIAADLAPDIKAVVESTLKKMKMNSTVFMGVFAEDSNACYAATLTQIHTEVGSDKT